MASHILVVSEWLPKDNHEQTLFESFQELARITLEKEKGCLKYHVTRQISHPGTKGESKFAILLIQEYENIEAFNKHCDSEHVSDFSKKHVGDESTSIIKDWRCRVFSEA